MWVKAFIPRVLPIRHTPIHGSSVPLVFAHWAGIGSGGGGRDDEERLPADIIEPAIRRYGYRKIAGLGEQAGWSFNNKGVERIWRGEGLKFHHKRPERGSCAGESCIRRKTRLMSASC
jgi:hypothetical protein